MYDVKITAIRQTIYSDLISAYENAMSAEQACPLRVGGEWVSRGGSRPEGLCAEAWTTLRPFVEALARGRGNFFDGWMRDPMSAMVSCNDGFRPMTFLVEQLPDGACPR